MKGLKLGLLTAFAAVVFLIAPGVKADAATTIGSGSGDIEAELEAAVQNGENDITIAPGTYTCGGAMIDGAGDLKITATGATITGSGSNPILYVSASGSISTGVTIEGGTWNGQSGYQSLRLFNTPSITIKNATFAGGKNAVYSPADVPNPTVVLENVTVSGAAESGINLNGCTNVSLTNVTVSGCGAQGLRLAGCNTVTINGATVKNNSDDGIYTTSASNTFSKVTATSNSGYGVNYQASAAGSISDSNITSNKNHNLFAKGCTAGLTVSNTTLGKSTGGFGVSMENAVVTLNNCTVDSNYWSGVRDSGSKSKLTVNGGSFCDNGKRSGNDDSNAAGIGVYDGASATISNATLSNNAKGCGIAPCGSKSAKVTVTVNSCTIESNGDHGIGARPYATISVNGGKIAKNTNHGIMLNTNCTAKKISGVTINNNGKAGVNINASCTVKSLTNCKIYKNKEDNVHVSNKSKLKAMSGCTIYGSKKASGVGVYSKSSAVIGNNNKIYSNKKYGVVADGTKTTLQMKGSAKKLNLVYGNSDTGIMIRKSAACSNLKYTKVYSNKKHGVSVLSKGSASLTSCTIEKNTKDGIRVQDSGTSVKLSSCAINSNKQNGLAATTGAKVKKLSKNTITKNKKYGVFLYSGAKTDKVEKNTIKKNKKGQISVSSDCSTTLKNK
ncbi:MAG: right-handed parallel beta-helix repeat-containing protein [Lachnospiraceae bacterium]|nr:right-handed parallel beta-helix repeat-containing protein [Lachnospiraceae bacterium]